MSGDLEDVDDTELEATDPGFVGGGGPAATIYGDDDDLDERGDALAEVDEDER
jgi:hypothetical protein